MNVNEDKMSKLLNMTGHRKKSKAIAAAIESFLRMKGKERLLSLRGKIKVENNWERLRHEEIKES